MAKYLVVVESPTKVKTLKKYLGKGYEVVASKGHVKDLPDRTLGVDVEKDFSPEYVVIPGKEKILRSIAAEAKKAEAVYLAPDPDREGEAIAWHIASEIDTPKDKIWRVLIQEITQKGVQDAIAHPSSLDNKRYESQQARRILDRLVGYKISPILWKKVRRGLSAGRVQSVAVRLICEREKDVRAFNPEEYWTINTALSSKNPPTFSANLYSVDSKRIGKELKVGCTEDAEKLRKRITEGGPILVDKVVRRERKKNPVPPFTTSKLQQEAFRKLGFNVKRTMSVAQSLYEGIDVEGEGPVGLITYMRTDSTRLSEEAIEFSRKFISKRFGDEFLPEKPNFYRTKKQTVQDAHEAIRPTMIDYHPDTLTKILNKDQYALYKLIWNRFMACQMKPAIYDQVSADLNTEHGKIVLKATGTRLVFKGFLEVYEEGHDEIQRRADQDETAESEDIDDFESKAELLPQLEVGEKVSLQSVNTNQHFTQPPPRFNESSLVKELDEKGIGRPSTYATILSTIIDRGYVKKVDNHYEPTALGEKVNELLVKAFPDILSVLFTAEMEDTLDRVEEGKVEWRKVLKTFYGPFSTQVSVAEKNMLNVKQAIEPTNIKCDRCGTGMLHIKWSSQGEFLGCSNYPKCRNSREFTRGKDGKVQIKEVKLSGDKCPKCNKDMIVKNGRYGEYISCIDYPTCPTVKSPQSDVNCPEKGCSGNLVLRKSRSGKAFWGCTNYPSCQYALWDKPINEICSNCSFPILTEKVSKRFGTRKICPSCKTVISVEENVN